MKGNTKLFHRINFMQWQVNISNRQIQKKKKSGKLKGFRGTHTTSFHLEYITILFCHFFFFLVFKTFSKEKLSYFFFPFFFLRIPGLTLKLRSPTKDVMWTLRHKWKLACMWPTHPALPFSLTYSSADPKLWMRAWAMLCSGQTRTL